MRELLSTPPQFDKPIVVFISSAQEEFEQFRLDLQETLNSEPWSNQKALRGVLIQNQNRDVIPNLIRDALDEASIYVGIFGRQLRAWVKDEFKYAKSCNLPQLIYVYEQPSGPGRPPRHRGAGRPSAVQTFLEDEAYGPGILVRGPYHDLDQLHTVIPADIAIVVAKMTRENADIRRTLYKGIPRQT